MQATEDPENNMSPSVARVPEAEKILFTLSSTHFRHEPEGRTGRLVTSTSVSVAIGQRTKFQKYSQRR
jgi:hypothetical protein